MHHATGNFLIDRVCALSDRVRQLELALQSAGELLATAQPGTTAEQWIESLQESAKQSMERDSQQEPAALTA